MNPTAHNVVITCAQGDIPAYHLVPADAAAAAPAIVLVHDFYGRDEVAQDAAARLAALGYNVVLPDLLAAKPPPEGALDDAALSDFAVGLSDSRVVTGIVAAAAWAVRQPGIDAARLGVVGWGWGGAYALMAAGHDARLRVAADIGGTISYPAYTTKRPGSPLSFVANLEGPLFAAFAGGDPLSPRMEVERLRACLIEHGKSGEVKLYENAPARFWRDATQPATPLLWRRLEAFLRAHLG